jgi:hypothetical protein
MNFCPACSSLPKLKNPLKSTQLLAFWPFSPSPFMPAPYCPPVGRNADPGLPDRDISLILTAAAPFFTFFIFTDKSITSADDDRNLRILIPVMTLPRSSQRRDLGQMVTRPLELTICGGCILFNRGRSMVKEMILHPRLSR